MEPRWSVSVITMRSSECNRIYLAPIPYKIKIGNQVITSCLHSKGIGNNYH